MNWDHAINWGRGVWVSVSDVGRVDQPEVLIGQPELKKNRKRVSGCLGWVVVRQNHRCVVNVVVVVSHIQRIGCQPEKLLYTVAIPLVVC